MISATVARGSVLRIVEWLLIGAAAGAICDVILGGSESFVLSAAESGALSPTLGIAIQSLIVLGLTLVALLAAGERSAKGLISGLAGSAIAYLIGATHLAALSIAVSVAVLGERAHRPPAATPWPIEPRRPRSSQRSKRKRSARR
jgi:hypothetical protein